MTGSVRRDRHPTLLGRPLPPAFASRVVVLDVGEHTVDHTEWRDAIVEVQAGEVHLVLGAGRRLCFRRGDVLWLYGLPLRAVRNPGPAPAVLVAVWRRHPDGR